MTPLALARKPSSAIHDSTPPPLYTKFAMRAHFVASTQSSSSSYAAAADDDASDDDVARVDAVLILIFIFIIILVVVAVVRRAAIRARRQIAASPRRPSRVPRDVASRDSRVAECDARIGVVIPPRDLASSRSRTDAAADRDAAPSRWAVCVRAATIDDLHAMQRCNLLCLPENYQLKYYLYHALAWPALLQVADCDGAIVGYVLAKLDEECKDETRGHITSLSVLRTHRKLGLAATLMRAAHAALEEVYDAADVSLHVRVSNEAALHLYRDVLRYERVGVEEKYYADGEDAYNMRKTFREGEARANVDVETLRTRVEGMRAGSGQKSKRRGAKR